MNSKKFSKALGNIGDRYVDEAVAYTAKRKNNIWLKWGTVAACLVVLIGFGMWQGGIFDAKPPITLDDSLNIGDKDYINPDEIDKVPNSGKYKEYSWNEENVAILWGWDELTTIEKYTEVEINGIRYNARSGRPLSESYIGNRIGSYTLLGYDYITDEKRTDNFDVYEINKVAPEQFVAVKMDEAYFVFKKDGFDPPKTLGELFEQIDLEQVVEFSRFSEDGGGPDDNHYILSRDDFIWDVLSECTRAPFIPDDNFFVHEREYISFSIISEPIGVYKNVIEITEDGYLSTNIFSYGYLFDIGEDAARRIIDYAKNNSTETDYEPYEKEIVGEVVEITEEYILVDDSLLYINPDDGITYKILLNNKRITRYIDKDFINKGDAVRVVYDGEIGENCVIAYAKSISDIQLYFENEENKSENNYSSTETTIVSHNTVILE